MTTARGGDDGGDDGPPDAAAQTEWIRHGLNHQQGYPQVPYAGGGASEPPSYGELPRSHPYGRIPEATPPAQRDPRLDLLRPILVGVVVNLIVLVGLLILVLIRT
ncbi:hypothetical protein [Pseudonocardia hydrocarbonoxydans]|jgi:hypothetical protein|uniref:Uncharacterized protein n=1 Tax=Pseudonocardia hydrocarbonoxydans TaxID=76726 RepID=A0A4Y3WT84_9PSEU|nr:hypothetical protein [Pseudonocardia hydrocarbonoxydans]GEC22095.1 hypothetical protein PHY01_43780 [Pseudonocardia hydrocarbonoxydans]